MYRLVISFCVFHDARQTAMRLSFISIYIVFLLALSPAWGNELAGLWQEYNDDTGNPEALIRITKTADDVYEGKIEKILPDTAENVTLLCTQCKGDLHNRPLHGLRILSGMKRHDKLTFKGGKIIDPDTGKIYTCNMRISEDDSTLKVTGYIGFSWIGQSETWRRIK
jgi:uncharacterized protein (DUF2147 family)